jgi:hypothetical protein
MSLLNPPRTEPDLLSSLTCLLALALLLRFSALRFLGAIVLLHLDARVFLALDVRVQELVHLEPVHTVALQVLAHKAIALKASSTEQQSNDRDADADAEKVASASESPPATAMRTVRRAAAAAAAP